MDKKQVERIAANINPSANYDETEILETNISWIILTEQYAYKIKRPVKLSFLDFSTLKKRKFFCEEELKLNSRLEPQMYLDILPITSDLRIEEPETDKEIVDYALRMRRMDNQKEMGKLLAENKVTSSHIDRLAKKIATFHKNAKVLKNAFRTLDFHEKYADIENQLKFVNDKLGGKFGEKIEECIAKSFQYLNANRSFSNERVISSFQRDCHGDLNSRNIFLYNDEPVIFDCIEFNPELRQIDVLNDIAFLCVDLDFFGEEDLSREFYLKYLTYSGYNDEPETRRLFNYYKSYRANIRAKVTLIGAKENQENDNASLLEDAKSYLNLMVKYMLEISLPRN